MLKHKLILILFLLFFVFRLALVLQNLMWLQDTANDQFFAVKIVNDLKAGKILVHEGITNSGLSIRYPPYYVYTLGFIRLINNTYEATLVVHIFLSFLLLIIIYKITKLLSSENGGLIALTIALVSPILIEESSVVYSAYFPLPFAFFSLYLLLKELLNKKPNATLILLSLFILAFLTTFSYALCFQLALSIILLIIFIKNRLQKFLYSLDAIIFFLLFNLQSILKYSIYEFVRMNFNSLFFPDKDIYRPGLYENLLQQFRSKPEIVFLGATLIAILFIYFVKSHSPQKNSKKAVSILFFYWIIASVLISRFGQFYKGIFAYPILYIVLGCFLGKITEDYLPKKLPRLMVAITTVIVFIVIPTLSLPRFRSLSSSHYYLSKQYAQKIVADENAKTLFLLVTERNNKAVHWSSLSIWYFDYLVHSQYYELFPKRFCPARIEAECFRVIPDKITIICSTESPETDIFEIVQKSNCVSEAERISLLTGLRNKYKVNGNYYYIDVDKIKYKNLTSSILR